MENNNRQGCRWTKEKPEFKKECVLVTATKYNRNIEAIDYYYTIWQIKQIDGEDEDGNTAWYWGLLNGDGEEYGALEDLRADYYRIISDPESIEPCATSSENYWKKRCEAAEKIVAIAGIVDCAGYDQWQKLKTMSDNYPSGISEIYPEVTGFLNSLPISKYQRKILYRALNQKPETKLAKEWRQLYEGMFDEWEEHHKALEEIRTIALNGYISSGWQKVIEITNKELNKPSNI